MTDSTFDSAAFQPAPGAARETAREQRVIPAETYKLNWPHALRSLKKLLDDKNDTTQVFEIMKALNGSSTKKAYAKLLSTVEGGAIAYERPELAERLMDRAYVESFAPGTVGAAYRAFLDATGYSADGLAAISQSVHKPVDTRHPYAWFGRRVRDCHDLWHVLTGYKGDEGLGEACLVAFSYAQTRGLGWATIAVGAGLRSGLGSAPTRAIREGYRHGKQAAWLIGEDYHALLNENLEDARRRLNIKTPAAYNAIPENERDWDRQQLAA